MSQIYSKDSFDRFGDDLMEVLLSYLSIEQKIKFECLSKQCQRVVFNKQFINNYKFNYNSNTIDLILFEAMVKKYPNITTILFGFISS